jgi:hypothetical protein
MAIEKTHGESIWTVNRVKIPNGVQPRAFGDKNE